VCCTETVTVQSAGVTSKPIGCWRAGRRVGAPGATSGHEETGAGLLFMEVSNISSRHDRCLISLFWRSSCELRWIRDASGSQPETSDAVNERPR
jgi:hypothetical protein